MIKRPGELTRLIEQEAQTKARWAREEARLARAVAKARRACRTRGLVLLGVVFANYYKHSDAFRRERIKKMVTGYLSEAEAAWAIDTLEITVSNVLSGK